MSDCVSDPRAGRRLLWTLSLTGAAAALFYLVQNRGWLDGGGIALPKLLWLGYAVLFWFCLPALIVFDDRTPAVWRRIYAVFLVNMLARGAVELFMMYVTGGWSPYYGIGHDLFTILLLLAMAAGYRWRAPGGLLSLNLYVVVAMLAVETGFVFYLLSALGGGEHAVYFVPEDRRHARVLQVTWLADLLLTGYLYAFSRRWIRGELVRQGGRPRQSD